MSGKCLRITARTVSTVVGATKQTARAARQLVDRHPGVVAGFGVGYATGILVERIPGVRFVVGPLPRIVCALGGAGVGYVAELAYDEVCLEEWTKT